MSGSLTKEQRRARVEDLQWMAETGESLTGACTRLRLTREALEKWCRGNGCLEVYHRLAAREHVDIDRVRKHDNRIYTRARSTAA